MQLHDVRDLEALVRSILRERLGNMKAELDEDASASAYSYLLGEAWILGLRYEASRGVKFSTLLWRFCGLRLVDWYRREFQDYRYRKEVPLSLDALAEPPRRRLNWSDEWVASSITPTLSFLQVADHADSVCERVDREAALRLLQPELRHAAIARAAGYRPTEIAAAQGVTVRTGLRRYTRAARQLRLAENGDGPPKRAVSPREARSA